MTIREELEQIVMNLSDDGVEFLLKALPLTLCDPSLLDEFLAELNALPKNSGWREKDRILDSFLQRMLHNINA